MKFLGVKIRFDLTALVLVYIFALWGWGLYEGNNVAAKVLVTALFVVAATASLLAHEFGHIVVGRRFGAACSRIIVFAFGALAELSHVGRRPREAFFIAAAGPAASFGLYGLFLLGALLAPEGLVESFLALAAFLNFLFGAFNLLLPIFPMDGGRVLHSLFWAVTGDELRGRRIAVFVAKAVLVSITALLLVLFFTGYLSWFSIV